MLYNFGFIDFNGGEIIRLIILNIFTIQNTFILNKVNQLLMDLLF